jgi:hypothetical protein
VVPAITHFHVEIDDHAVGGGADLGPAQLLVEGPQGCLAFGQFVLAPQERVFGPFEIRLPLVHLSFRHGTGVLLAEFLRPRQVAPGFLPIDLGALGRFSEHFEVGKH